MVEKRESTPAVPLLICVLYLGVTNMPALMKIAASVSGISG
jgi:hypothetical protein